MAMDIQWTIIVQVPQLDALIQTLETIGVAMADALSGIKDALIDLNNQQAASSQALADQLTAIAVEIDQVAAAIAAGGPVSQEQLDAIAQHIRDAAKIASDQAAQIAANTASIEGMVTPAPPPA